MRLTLFNNVSLFQLMIFIKWCLFILQDVVYALAHATAQSGRFTLVERWRNNERFLAPFENPLTVIIILYF